MKKISVQLTLEELQAVVTLTENQFFRMKYIDPKMPGYRPPQDFEAAKSGAAVLVAALKTEKGWGVKRPEPKKAMAAG